MQLTTLTPDRRGYPLALTEALRQRRIELGMTQREVADRLDGKASGGGMTQSNVATWEKGQAVPTPDRFAQWAAVLGVRVVIGLQEIPKEVQ